LPKVKVVFPRAPVDPCHRTARRVRNVVAAEAAARELPLMTLENALLLVVLYAKKGDRRFERAALRWHARLELEAKQLTLAWSQLVSLVRRRQVPAVLRDCGRAGKPFAG
jgi:hypothetical protein